MASNNPPYNDKATDQNWLTLDHPQILDDKASDDEDPLDWFDKEPCQFFCND